MHMGHMRLLGQHATAAATAKRVRPKPDGTTGTEQVTNGSGNGSRPRNAGRESRQEPSAGSDEAATSTAEGGRSAATAELSALLAVMAPVPAPSLEPVAPKVPREPSVIELLAQITSAG